VFYHLHWLNGQHVEVIRRCPQYGPDRIQILPPDGKQRVICDWMMDEQYCRRCRQESRPLVSVDALVALGKLLDSQTLLKADSTVNAIASLNTKGGSDAKKQSRPTEEVQVVGREPMERASSRKARKDRKASGATNRSSRQGRQTTHKGKR
jgi:hypothetical protein